MLSLREMLEPAWTFFLLIYGGRRWMQVWWMFQLVKDTRKGFDPNRQIRLGWRTSVARCYETNELSICFWSTFCVFLSVKFLRTILTELTSRAFPHSLATFCPTGQEHIYISTPREGRTPMEVLGSLPKLTITNFWNTLVLSISTGLYGDVFHEQRVCHQRGLSTSSRPAGKHCLILSILRKICKTQTTAQ